MENFDKIRTSIFGHSLAMTAISSPLPRDLARSEVKIEIVFQGLKATIVSNGPITHAALLRKTEANYPRTQIRKELLILEGLFLENYTSYLSRMAVLEKVFWAYRELGPVLNITTSKPKQDVTNGNS
jgi:hypothetical protein